MKTIGADYNAMTEAGHVRLTLPCSQEGVSRLGLHAGDWAWLSDGEVIVGAQLAIDDRYGLVGVPDWDTIVPLDEEGADDFERIKAALNPLVTREPPSTQDKPRVLQLITQLEYAAPPQIRDARRVDLRLPACPRASPDGKARSGACSRRKRLDAPSRRPGSRLRLPRSPPARGTPLRRRASRNLRRIAGCAGPHLVGVHQHPRDPGGAGGRRPVRAGRPPRPRLVSAARSGPRSRSSGAVARGPVLLQSRIRAPCEARISRARQAFERAQQIYPVGPMLDEVTGLQTYDRHAREVARRVRTIAEQFPTKPVAA